MQETMRDPAIERLAKIISDRNPNEGGTGDDKNAHPRKPLFRLHLHLDEGWFSLFLLATVVYSTIWCVQAVDWVDHLNVLSLTTLLGLICGVVAAKQQRFPRLAVHLAAVIFGLLLAYWQTAGAFYAGSPSPLVALAAGMQRWFVSIMAGGTSEDNSIFLFFITALGFLLSYTSAWLVYRTRSPWLMIVANAVVLLINLSFSESGYIVFLVVFLMASLLLLLRFNLYESIKRWRRQGLRYADDLGWDVMQAGALISIAILVFSWFLPWGYTNDVASQIWNANANPLVQLEDTWNRVFSFSGGANPSNHGSFTDTLVLGGNPNLNTDIVFTVKTTDPSQYLAAVSYGPYDGQKWAVGPTSGTSVLANEPFLPGFDLLHPVVQQINVVNPPGGQGQYFFGASQIGQVNQPSVFLNNNASASSIAVLSKNSRLAAGEQYTVTSYVSSADEATLHTVPMPADSPSLPPDFDGQTSTSFEPSVVSTYTQLPGGLDPRIADLARQLTKDKPTMYDKVEAIEQYLKNPSNFTYDANIRFPFGAEGASWLLFTSHRGFCNYFATAMTVMVRSLGIPARVEAGYASNQSGQYDAKSQSWVIRGTAAHSWTQVNFAGYGWINFEPSVSFSSFTRPVAGQFKASTPISGPNGSGSGSKNPTKPHVTHNDSTDHSGSLSPQSGQAGAVWGQRAGLALGSIILLCLFSLIFFTIWWRRLFRSYGLSAQIYGRICIMANWAGIPISRSQTPYEYINGLAAATPTEAKTLERFGDIYVRERWADPASPEHPRFTGEVKELPALWQSLQPQLFLYVLRHPYILRKLPVYLWDFLSSLRDRRRAHYDFDEDL